MVQLKKCFNESRGTDKDGPFISREMRSWQRSKFTVQFMHGTSLILHLQGVAGLSARDIKLFVDAGLNTVESVAYT